MQRFCVFMLLMQALLGFAAAASAEQERNWMREHVERVQRATASRALGHGADELKAAPQIVGGRWAQASDNPFQVGLLFKDIKTDFYAQYCGGTLIAPSVIVTAAHCSDFVRSLDVQVLVGSRFLDGSGRRINVTHISVHPRYDPYTLDFDVAVWFLAERVSGMPVARLAHRDGPAGRLLTATGWGALGEAIGYPSRLYKVEVPLVERAECKKSYGRAFSLSMLCAGEEQGGAGTCFGDSGGPLARGNRLFGIVSWGIGCARPYFYGVYTRISHDPVRRWIERKIGHPA